MSVSVPVLSLVIISFTTHTIAHEMTTESPLFMTEAEILEESLLFGYNNKSRPYEHIDNLKLNVRLSVDHLHLSDKRGIMNIGGHLAMTWSDKRMSWNATEHRGIMYLNVASHKLWVPSVEPFNIALDNANDIFQKTLLNVYYKGEVTWTRQFKTKIFCQMDLVKWPSDEYICSLLFGVWIDHGELIIKNFDVSHSIRYGGWMLLSMSQFIKSIKYQCCKNVSFGHIEYEIHVQRDSGRGLKNQVRAPLIISAIIALLAHCLPLRSMIAYRSSLTIIPFVVILLSLIYFEDRLPVTEIIPNIVKLYYISLCMVSISGITSVLALKMATTKMKLIDMTEDVQGSIENVILVGSTSSSRDWLPIANIINHITFIILLVMFITIGFIYDF